MSILRNPPIDIQNPKSKANYKHLSKRQLRQKLEQSNEQMDVLMAEYEGSSDEETWNDKPYDRTFFQKPTGKERKAVAKQFDETANRMHNVTLKIKRILKINNQVLQAVL